MQIMMSLKARRREVADRLEQKPEQSARDDRES